MQCVERVPLSQLCWPYLNLNVKNKTPTTKISRQWESNEPQWLRGVAREWILVNEYFFLKARKKVYNVSPDTSKRFYFKKDLSLRKDRTTSHRLTMKIETRTAAKMSIAIFGQEFVEVTMDRINIRTFVATEINMKETIKMELDRKTKTTAIT